MAITVRIPSPLRTLTGGRDEVTAPSGTLREVLEHLESAHPGLKERLVGDAGIRRFVNIYANEEDVRFLQNLDTEIKDGDTVSIIPALAGG